MAEIKEILNSPKYSKKEALKNHKDILLKKRNRLNELISLVEITIKGEKDMSFKQFDMTEIENAKANYADEVKVSWGNTSAYAESEKNMNAYNSKQWEIITTEGNEILKEFAKIKDELKPDSKKARELVKKWQEHITVNFYNCSNDILVWLGKMYVEDERFTKNIDKNGKGTSEFIAKAIECCCKA